jgi:hypothetical protein
VLVTISRPPGLTSIFRFGESETLRLSAIVVSAGTGCCT